MRLVDNLKTCYGQILERGTQVAYCTKPEVKYLSGSHINVISFSITPGELKVSHIVTITEVSAGFAEADPEYELTLSDGAKVSCTDVAVTDGHFKYGTRG